MGDNKKISEKEIKKKKLFSIISWSLFVIGLVLICCSRFQGVSNTVGQIGAWVLVATLIFSLFNTRE